MSKMIIIYLDSILFHQGNQVQSIIPSTSKSYTIIVNKNIEGNILHLLLCLKFLQKHILSVI